jgi:N-methylhydantoinase A/oxoprolinase/acetone carboxylase beta subunit
VRIGVDVGGTNTDAVVMDGREVVAAAKRPTTEDVTGGIVAALRSVLGARSVPGTCQAPVQAVMIGTTHFTNALAQARDLERTAIVRLSSVPQTLRPGVDWPEPLLRAIGADTFLCEGGREFNGEPIVPLDRDELRRVGGRIREAGIRVVAVSSVFAPVNQDDEEEARRILEEELPDAAVVVSHEIGSIGLLERENATIVNASLRSLAARIGAGLEAALAELGIDAPVFLAQNDGTLMTVDYAVRYPVLTLASGPTNSMRGAAFLSGVEDCAVVDVGGTTSDVGILANGFPRQASVAIRLSGVRTNFRMPDVLSLALGGGSVVRHEPVSVGPDSVGYRLPERALVFGGDTLTTTDVAVAAGLVELGDPARVRDLEPALVEGALALVETRIAEAIDRMKPHAGELPVVLVGGGSVLVRPDRLGASEVVTPPHHAVANAIGAAIAQVGGEIDRVYSLQDSSRADALEDARREATEKAVAAGADPATVSIVHQEDVPLTHLPGGVATRVRVKAVGDLRLEGPA